MINKAVGNLIDYQKLAQLLGWKLLPNSNENREYRDIFKGNYNIWFERFFSNKKIMLQARGSFRYNPNNKPCGGVYIGNRDSSISINFSVDKPIERIANDLRTRLIPAYIETYDRLLAIHLKEDKELKVRQALTADLANIVGLKPWSSHDNCTIHNTIKAYTEQSANNPKYITEYISVYAYVGSRPDLPHLRQHELKLNHLTEEEVRFILSYIARKQV